jgi:hypothetical protein
VTFRAAQQTLRGHYGSEIAGAVKPANVRVYEKLSALKPTNSSLQFGLGHVNCAAASSGEIVTDCAGTTNVPFLDGVRVALVSSEMEALCGSTMLSLPGL